MTWLEFLDHRNQNPEVVGEVWPRLLTPILGGFVIEAVAVLFTISANRTKRFMVEHLDRTFPLAKYLSLIHI